MGGITGLRTRPGSSGRPALQAMAVRTGSDQVHGGPLGAAQAMEWTSLQTERGGFGLSGSGALTVPKPGIYLCALSFNLLGVGGLTSVRWHWFVDGLADLQVLTNLVPGASQSAVYGRTAELLVTGEVTARWIEGGATGTSLLQNSTLSVAFLRPPS